MVNWEHEKAYTASANKVKKCCGTCCFFKPERYWPNDGECLFRPVLLSAALKGLLRNNLTLITRRSGRTCMAWRKK